MHKLILASLLSLLTLAYARADVVTQWDFEGDDLTPAVGAGTAQNVGGTSSAFATGNGGGRGWNTSAYPAQSTASGTAGVAFFVDTTGWRNIGISFDHRASGTASRWAQLDYSIDGGSNWVTGFWNNGGGLSPHDNFYSFDVDLSSVSAVNNNAGFGFRIVSIFSPEAFNQNTTLSYGANEAYMRANAQAKFTEAGEGTGNYGGAGTWRFDNMTVSATAVPEPGSMAVLAIAGFGGVVLRRYRRKASPVVSA